MSEESYKEIVSGLTPYPEYDDPDDFEKTRNEAFFNGLVIDIIDVVGQPDFEETYKTLKVDIDVLPIKRKRILCQKVVDRIKMKYDFEFPIAIELDTEYDIKDFFEFLEFIEYDNYLFLSFIWENLAPADNLMKLDVEQFCKSNSIKIMKEVYEQLDSHDQSELISVFLRTYYKEKFIDWFIKKTNKSKGDIAIEILRRKGKLKNG